MSIDYKAAATILFYQDGNRYTFKIEATKKYYLDLAHQVIDAALGDTVLYAPHPTEVLNVKVEPSGELFVDGFVVQVYPEGDSE